MEIRIIKNGFIKIDNAEITHCNFSGNASKFNHEGNRSFAVCIDSNENANILANEGLHINRDRTLPVKVKFNSRGPNVYLRSGENDLVQLDEETIGGLGGIAIKSRSVDLYIRLYDWKNGDRSGRTAYLDTMCVTV